MRTVEVIRNEVLLSNEVFEVNEVLYIIDKIVDLKNEQIENIARNLEAQGKQHDKEKEQIIKALESELELADKEKERCVKENPLQFDSAKGYSGGIYRAIEIVKEGGVE